MTKFGFYLLNYKGLYVLESVLNRFNSSSISFVCVGRDKNVHNDYAEEIIRLCRQHNIEIIDKNKEINDHLDTSFKFAIGWRWIINNSDGLIILHDSLLPRYRGFAPLVNSLINGEKEIGVTALFAEKEYDTGDIIQQDSIKIEYPIKVQKAIEKISTLYKDVVLTIMERLINCQPLNTKKQEEKLATYSLWRDEEDYHIDWSVSSEKIKRIVDALGFPYKGAYSVIGDKKK